jgi:signal transduction histidine kinase
LHSEKLAGIGQLAAGVAHEINNPIGYIMSNFSRLEEYLAGLKEVLTQYRNHAEESEIADTIKKVQLDFILEDIDTIFTENDEGLERIKKIVQNLRDFSRVDSQEDFEKVCLNDNLENTLNVAKNEIKYAAEVETDFGDIGVVECHPGEINQVFLNILINAAQAVKSDGREELGKIKVKTWESDSRIYCKISNNGPPIPKEVVSKVFDPFFTTKDVGKGTGLGLNISYDIIVNKHKGEIKVESGEETAFIIALPKKQ